MGGCKDNMKTTKDQEKNQKEDKGFLGILPRKRKVLDKEETAKTFADMVELVDKKINELVLQKEVELKQESGREEYNRQALAILKTIQFHVDEVIEQMAQYNELK